MSFLLLLVDGGGMLPLIVHLWMILPLLHFIPIVLSIPGRKRTCSLSLTLSLFSSIPSKTGFGFNPGSALMLGPSANYGGVAANAAVATALGGASGGISALFTNLWIEERMSGEPKFVILMAMNGTLSGLVSVTSGCAVIEPWAAIVAGTIAGWLYMYSSNLLIRLRIDDAVNAIPVHLVCGVWGLLVTGFLASPSKIEYTYSEVAPPGLFYSFGSGVDASLLVNHICAIFFIGGWTFCSMMPIFIWLNYRYVRGEVCVCVGRCV
jgi:Amt family ammonium transporter